jgi:trimeric autotransporter adhesin
MVSDGIGCGGGQNCNVLITFTPSALGPRTATLVTTLGDIPLSGNGIPDGPSFTLPTFSFPPTQVNLSSVSPPYLYILDNGSTTLALSATVSGLNASDFVVTSSAPPSPYSCGAQPASECLIPVVFTPSQSGVRTATLTVTDSTTGFSQSTSLSGTEDPMAPTITPNQLSFGNIQVGSVSGTQTVTVTAPNGDQVIISGTNLASAGFTVSAGTCMTQTPCQVSVSFQPSATGLKGATLSAEDVVTLDQSTIPLTGTGGVAGLSLSSSSLTFAAHDEGSTSIAQTVTLTNTGNSTLTFSAFSFVGANPGDFVLDANTCGSTEAPGANCTLSISFSPTASGARTAALQIVSNSPSSPDAIQLAGTGN